MQFIYDQGVMVWPLPSQMRMVGVQVRMAVCEEFWGQGRPKSQDSGQPCGADHGQSWGGEGLCCTNPMRDSSRESSVVAVRYEQTRTPRLQDQELARL